MLKAVTNRNFPMLGQALQQLFGIGLDYDPALDALAHLSFRSLFARMARDPAGRIRIVYVDGSDDLSRGWFNDRDVIGNNVQPLRLIRIAVPDEYDFTSEGCAYVPKSLDSYLLAVTLHELYELLTGDVYHCHHPGICVNSVCRVSDCGYCCLCMGGLIDAKWPDLALEDLYCDEDLGELRQALGRNGLHAGRRWRQ